MRSLTVLHELGGNVRPRGGGCRVNYDAIWVGAATACMVGCSMVVDLGEHGTG
jgi:hypothetical protein